MCETGVFYTVIQRFDLRLYAKHRAFAHISVFFVPERFRAMRLSACSHGVGKALDGELLLLRARRAGPVTSSNKRRHPCRDRAFPRGSRSPKAEFRGSTQGHGKESFFPESNVAISPSYLPRLHKKRFIVRCECKRGKEYGLIEPNPVRVYTQIAFQDRFSANAELNFDTRTRTSARRV